MVLPIKKLLRNSRKGWCQNRYCPAHPQNRSSFYIGLWTEKEWYWEWTGTSI